MLKKPDVMLECLPVLFGHKNDVISSMIENLQFPHLLGIDMLK